MHLFGNHVVGQPAAQVFLHLLSVEVLLLYDEMQLALVVAVVFGNDGHAAFSVEKTPCSMFYLAQFDAESLHLYL